MIPVYQTITNHNPEEGRYGDCMRACVASLFELSPTQVPNFCDELLHGDFLAAIQTWARPRGFVYANFSMLPEELKTLGDGFRANGIDAYHLLGGKSGIANHICVAQYCEVVHDPWPKTDSPWHGVLLPDDNGRHDLGLFLPLFHGLNVRRPEPGATS